MPRKEPENAEPVVVSPEDAELLDFFSIRRTFEKDGSIRYVQLIGRPDVLDAASRNENIARALARTVKDKKIGSFSLPRMIAQRMLNRPLLSHEVVIQTNEKKGDVRRSNLEITTRAEIASRERTGTWSATGAKYVYIASNGRFYAQIGDLNLGTYENVEDAAKAVDEFQQMTAEGMDEKEAALRLLNRARNASKTLVKP